MHRRRVLEGPPVILQRGRREEFRRLGGTGPVLREVGARIGADDRLRNGSRLRQEEPVPVGHGEGHVGAPVVLPGGEDVEDGEPLHPFRVIERQAVGDPPAPVVSDEREILEAEMAHHGDLVARHRPLRIGLVVRRRGGLGTPAIAAQIGRNDGKALGELRDDPVPHHMRLRVAVEEQKPRAASADAGTDRGFRRHDIVHLEPVKHRRAPQARPRGAPPIAAPPARRGRSLRSPR